MSAETVGLIAGIDLGGTTIKAAVADRQGVILADESIPTDAHRGSAEVLDRIGNLIEQIAHSVGPAPAQITAIGMGVPGWVDVNLGVTKFLPNFPGHWSEVPVADTLGARFGCPVGVLNDVRMATLGELRFGHGRERSNPTLVFLSLGTGVGGGLVIDGRLRLGALGSAGEMGHQTLLPEGPRCGCGNRGCLETLASGPAIAAEGTRLMQIGLAPTLRKIVGDDAVTPQAMHRAATDDPAIREAIQNAARFVGIALANTVTTLHPELVVLGGGVAQFGDLLLDTVRQTIQQRVRMFPTDHLEILRSELGTQAGVAGAIAFAMPRDPHAPGPH